ncbi:MAG TPA: SbcC/MukB-like Walker B domain-containing protein [Pilimelia sp.]|nr:SbcC/MukB-like Walker B domain-containing protein [Pilimelia sp.]
MTSELPYDVLTGTPEPTRRRWQPLRAGILNLFRYDDQTFVFHNGRLLLRGNNGSGKSMAVEVLIPYVLDADLSPQRLSTFGGRDRGMFLWLLGHEQPPTRANARAYVWVEFGRRRPDGAAEYLTAGAGLEGLRSDSSVKAFYWTTAARVGIQLHLGGPGAEPLTRQALAAALAEHAAGGLPGRVHPDARSHRRAVNDALYGLHERRFDALRATLLQLRRPKLSDKLNEESLNLILRNSLAPVSSTIVQDLAEGFERLDRHAAAVAELRGVIEDLRSLQAAYRRYARIAGAARADAVVASERAIRAARERAGEATAQRDAAVDEGRRVAARRAAIGERRARISGRQAALREREAYRQGRNLDALRELVRGLGAEADRLEGQAAEWRRTAERDAHSTELASRAAGDAQAEATSARFDAEAAAVAAVAPAVDALHRALAAAVDEVRGRDVDTEEALLAAVAEVRALAPAVPQRSRAWAGTVAALQKLRRAAGDDDARLLAAQAETERADAEAGDAEGALNEALDADRDATLAWVRELTAWAQASPQLCAGQAPPLPWEPAVALDRAPRWAREAYDARTAQLAGARAELDAGAVRAAAVAASWAAAAQGLDDLATTTATAGAAAREHRDAAARYRAGVQAWLAGLRELPLGGPPPDWAGLPPHELPAVALAWAERAADARGAELAADAARLELRLAAARERVIDLEAERDRLAVAGLPDLPAPATRGATRDGRPGAPFYLLVDFAPGVGDADRRGIEAAAIGAGLADAWVVPDGRLLAGPDGAPLLDTQLTVGTRPVPAGAAALSTLLVPDPACARAGVPADVVAALLDRVAVADTAAHHPHGLVVGRDGTWRSGPLTGAHAVAAVTLIGAANREADRLARLARTERDLATARADVTARAEEFAARAAATDRLRAERAALPTASQMLAAEEAARRATADARTGLRAAERQLAEAYGSSLGEPAPPEDVTAAGRATHGGWTSVAAAVAAEPAHPDVPTRLASLRDRAADTAQRWSGTAATLRERAAATAASADTARKERDALPSDEPVRQARAALDLARRQLESARTRLHGRRDDERRARDRASGSAAALTAALRAEGLPADADPEALGAALDRYHTQAARWLTAEAEAVRGSGAAGLAAARSLHSADRAERAARLAAERRADHRTRQATLDSLSDAYGLAYVEIVGELDRLSAEDDGLAAELEELRGAELDCVNAQAVAEAAQRDADRMRDEAVAARTTAGAAFLTAARLGVLTAAGLPDNPAAGNASKDRTDDEEPGPPTGGLGVRALRDWATAVREAAGDAARTVAAVERAANRVTETRHSLEPRLAGRVVVRDEQREQLLLLHVNRAGRTLPLHEMIDVLGGELARDGELLAREEAELFRRFLAGETRREVTTKVRDARTTIRAMTELMAAHPTGSGIQVRLRWVPDDKNAPGMQDVVALMAKDAPLDSEKERLQAFFRQRVDRVRTGVDADWTTQLTELLDYRQWWRFQLEYRRSRDEGWTALNSKTHGALSGGEKAVCLHLPLFAAAATYCDSASVRAVEADGRDVPGCPRLIVLDEVFAGVDEDNRGALFDIVRTLDLDMVATSESEQGFYPQLDGVAVYHLVSSDALGCVLASRTVWDGRAAHRLLDGDLVDAP